MRRAAIVVAILAAGVPAPARASDDGSSGAEAIVQALKAEYGDGYTTVVDHKRRLVFCSALDPVTYDRVRDVLGRLADRLRADLFVGTPGWHVTVVLPTEPDFRREGPPAKAIGYYVPEERRIVSLSLSSTLLHEFVHALHHWDQAEAGEQHPVWVVEGLAVRYQAARFPGDRPIEFGPPPGLLELKRALEAGRCPGLADLLEMGRETFTKNAELAYPAAGAVIACLADGGRLKPFYEALKRGWQDDPTGRTALEEAFGAPLAEVEKQWHAWIRAQREPWRPGYEVKAHLGIRMGPAEAGVRVDGLVRGGAAARGGKLEVGDVVITLADRPTPSPEALRRAVQSCRPGETVEIEVLRDGRTVVLHQILGVARP